MTKTLRAILVLGILAIASVWAVSFVWAAETGEFNSIYTLSDDTMRRAVSTYWPDVDSSEAVISLQPLWGAPSGLWKTTFYDDVDGQALVAEAAGDRTYFDPDGYEVDDLSDGQISLYRCELDGTTNALTTSVWSIDVFYWIEDSNWRGEPQ